MNIRSVSNPAEVLASELIQNDKRNIKSDETADREPDGRQPYPETPERPLTEEEMELVLTKLREHEGIVNNNLQVNLYEENDKQLVKIETQEGEVVKRIVQRDLFHFLYENQKNFNLVKKTA